jgi:hypothetical protein
MTCRSTGSHRRLSLHGCLHWMVCLLPFRRIGAQAGRARHNVSQVAESRSSATIIPCRSNSLLRRSVPWRPNALSIPIPSAGADADRRTRIRKRLLRHRLCPIETAAPTAVEHSLHLLPRSPAETLQFYYLTHIAFPPRLPRPAAPARCAGSKGSHLNSRVSPHRAGQVSGRRYMWPQAPLRS